MTENISFRQASYVASFALAVGGTTPVTLPSAIGVVALGALGCLGMEVLCKLKEAFDYVLDKRRYQVAHSRDFNMKTDNQNMRCALERVKRELPETFQEYKKIHKLASDEDFIRNFQSLVNGTCYGQVSTLLKRSLTENSYFNKNHVMEMTAEEVFFMHMVQHFYNYFETKLKVIDAEIAFEALNLRISGKEVSIEQIKENKENEFKAILESIRKVDPLRSFQMSKAFYAINPEDYYQQILESMSSPSGDFMGYVAMPKHVLAIQHTPAGYFLYNTNENVGLIYYPDKETFLQRLRAQILHDIETVGKQISTAKIRIGFARK